MTMPGFNAESSLGPTTSSYQGKVSSYIWGGDNVMPQFRLGSVGDPDIGAYLSSAPQFPWTLNWGILPLSEGGVHGEIEGRARAFFLAEEG